MLNVPLLSILKFFEKGDTTTKVKPRSVSLPLCSRLKRIVSAEIRYLCFKVLVKTKSINNLKLISVQKEALA